MLSAGILPEQLLVEFDQINQPLTPLFWIDLVRILRAPRRGAIGWCIAARNYVFVLSPRSEREMPKLLLVEQYFFPEGWGARRFRAILQLGCARRA